MTANEEKVLKILKKSKGRKHILQIAKELGISSGYAELLLKALQRQRKIEFSGRWASLPRREPKALLRGLILTPPAEKKRVIKKEAPPASAKAMPGKPKKKAKKRRKKTTKTFLMELDGMTKALEKSLRKAGYKNIEEIAKSPVSRLMEDTGLKLKQAAELINKARRILKIIPDTISGEEKQKTKEKKERPKRVPKRKKKKREKKRKEEKKVPWPIKVLKQFFG